MAVAVDFLVDADGNLLFEDGDLRVGDSDDQHAEHILNSSPGAYSQHPLLGAGLQRLLGGSFDAQRVARDIRLQLRSDNFRVFDVTVRSATREVDLKVERIR